MRSLPGTRQPMSVPQSLFMNSECCGGKLGATQPATVSVASLWHFTFTVKLDAIHLMLRIGREMNAEHPHRETFFTHLSMAIFVQYEDDR